MIRANKMTLKNTYSAAVLTGLSLSLAILHGCASWNKHYFGIRDTLETIGPACNVVDERVVHAMAATALTPYDGIIFHGVGSGYKNVTEDRIIGVDGAFARELLGNERIVSDDESASGECRITFTMETFFTSFKAIRTPIEYRVEYLLRDGEVQRVCLGPLLNEMGAHHYPEDFGMTLDLDKFPNLRRDMIAAKAVLQEKAEGDGYRVSEVTRRHRILGSPCFDANGEPAGYRQIYSDLDTGQ